MTMSCRWWACTRWSTAAPASARVGASHLQMPTCIGVLCFLWRVLLGSPIARARAMAAAARVCALAPAHADRIDAHPARTFCGNPATRPGWEWLSREFSVAKLSRRRRRQVCTMQPLLQAQQLCGIREEMVDGRAGRRFHRSVLGYEDFEHLGWQ